MPEFSDYIVFVDESGDHTLPAIDPQYPMFVLAFCLATKEAYASRITPEMLHLKVRHFGHDQVVLHEGDIRKNRGPFAILRNPEIRTAFQDDLTRLIVEAPFSLIACAVRKDRYVAQTASPQNPYHLALEFGLEALYRHLEERGCRTGRTFILFERRGPKEDAELELEFRRIRDGANWLKRAIPFEAVFCDKKANSCGLQLSDLVARPIGRKLLDPLQSNRAYDVLERKFRRSPSGQIEEWGLKVFP